MDLDAPIQKILPKDAHLFALCDRIGRNESNLNSGVLDECLGLMYQAQT